MGAVVLWGVTPRAFAREGEQLVWASRARCWKLWSVFASCSALRRSFSAHRACHEERQWLRAKEAISSWASSSSSRLVLVGGAGFALSGNRTRLRKGPIPSGPNRLVRLMSSSVRRLGCDDGAEGVREGGGGCAPALGFLGRNCAISPALACALEGQEQRFGLIELDQKAGRLGQLLLFKCHGMIRARILKMKQNYLLAS